MTWGFSDCALGTRFLQKFSARERRDALKKLATSRAGSHNQGTPKWRVDFRENPI